MTKRVFPLIAAVVLLVGSETLAAQLRVGAPISVVAPWAQTTVVSLEGQPSRPLTIDSTGFAGRVGFGWDPDGRRYLLAVTPRSGSPPSSLPVLREGRQLGLVQVYPVPPRTDSVSALESTATLPDPASRDYITFSQRKGRASTPLFNGAMRDSLRRLQIAGDRVVIEASGTQGLLERLMPAGQAALDVDSITIYANELVIAAPVEVPGATVRIYANTVQFRDPPAQTAFLSTTPRGQSPVTTAGQAGSSGQAGGDIYLHVRHPLDPAQLSVARFIAVGGPGQKGGPPTKGTRGTNLPTDHVEPRMGGMLRSWNQMEKVIHNGPLPPGWEHNVVWFRRDGRVEVGAYNSWPTDAGGGRAGGAPGLGGLGGTVHSTVLLPSEAVRVGGGPSGDRQETAEGASGGSPQPAIGVDIESVLVRRGRCHQESCEEDVYKAVYHIYVHRSRDAPAIPSPIATQPTGDAGRLVQDLRGSVHPIAAQATLTYVEDLYRLGFLTAAGERLRELRAALTSADTLTGQPARAYLPLRQRVEALLARQATNLDYFGNPAGWVPALDFPALLAVLSNEVGASAPTLVMTERLRSLVDSGRAQVASLQGVRDAGAAEIARFEGRLNLLATRLPALGREADAVARDEQAFLQVLQQREGQLIEEARDRANPRPSFLLGAVRTLGAVAKVLPVGQPIVGSIGAAADLITRAADQPLTQTLQEIPDVASQFSRQNLDQSVASFRTTAQQVAAMDPRNPRQFFSQVQGAASTVGASLAQYRQAQEAARAPASVVEAILQQLKAQDPSYRNLLEQTASLAQRKAALAQEIEAVSNEMGETTSRVAVLTANVDVLNGQLTAAQDLVDSPALQAANSIGQAVRSRLDYYHYLLIKAYEYYTAEAYSGNRRAGATAEVIGTLLRDHNNDPTLTASAFTTAYTEEIRSVGQRLIQRLTVRGPGQELRDITIPIVGNNLARVNEMLGAGDRVPDVLIPVEDLGLFPITDYEARIQDVQVATCDCRLLSGGAAGAHIRFDIAPVERGMLRTAARSIGFVQPVSALAWGAAVDLSSGAPVIRSVVVPLSVGRALEAAFNIPAGNASRTAPALLPGLTLRAQLQAGMPGGSTRAEVRRLVLKINYSYYPRLDLRGIRVVPTGTEAAPSFFVSLADESGQQHATGAFTRTYAENGVVQITAPSAVGDRGFVGWFRLGQRVERSTTITIPQRAGSYHYEARYAKR